MSDVVTLNVVETVTRPGMLRWRVRILAETNPEMPDEALNAPVWVITPGRVALLRGEDCDDVGADVLNRAVDAFGRDSEGQAKLLRWLRMFRGVTTAQIVNVSAAGYLICDPLAWRVSVGYDADNPSDISIDVHMWRSWVKGHVYRLELQNLPLTVNPWNATETDWVSGGTVEPRGEYPFFDGGELSDIVYGLTEAVAAATEVLGDRFRLTPSPDKTAAPAGFRHVQAVHLRPGMVCDLSGDRYADDSTDGHASIYLFECVEVTAVGLVAVSDGTNAVEVCFVGVGGDAVARFPVDWDINVKIPPV